MILALLLDKVELADAAKVLLFLAAASIVGGFLVKKALKNYSHINGLAEDFLKSADVLGAVKEAISDIASDCCKKDDEGNGNDE